MEYPHLMLTSMQGLTAAQSSEYTTCNTEVTARNRQPSSGIASTATVTPRHTAEASTARASGANRCNQYTSIDVCVRVPKLASEVSLTGVQLAWHVKVNPFKCLCTLTEHVCHDHSGKYTPAGWQLLTTSPLQLQPLFSSQLQSSWQQAQQGTAFRTYNKTSAQDPAMLLRSLSQVVVQEILLSIQENACA